MAQAPKSGGQNPKGKTRRELARKSVAENRQARRNYAILDDLEVGTIHTGPEVKSPRAGPPTIA